MKRKGTRAERELFHMFWDNGWGCARSAGSGSTTRPSPDLLVGYKGRYFALECKSLKDTRKYFHKTEIEQLKEFADRFGAEPIIAVRFDGLGWFFFSIDNMEKTKGDYFVVSRDLAKEKGLSFDEFISLK